jgi:hypothetical protein
LFEKNFNNLFEGFETPGKERDREKRQRKETET